MQTLVAKTPVTVTMPALLTRFFAAELGLSLSPAPVGLDDSHTPMFRHASYDRDPAHARLRQLVLRLAEGL